MTDPNWRDLPPLSTLRAFEATARLSGYSAAARSLNVTPAAIAQQVRKLETEMGTALVRRQGRGLTLTSAGQDLSQPLREAFALIANGIDTVKQKDAMRGLRVSTTTFFADEVVFPRLKEFWTKHPGLQVSFSPDGNDASVDLENFDIAIRGSLKGAVWDGYDATPILRSRLMIAAAPALLEGVEDIRTLPWIRERSVHDTELLDVASRAGFDVDTLKIVDTGSAKFEIEAALQGFGLSMGAEIVFRKYLEEGALVEVETPFKEEGWYYLIQHKGPQSQSVAKFTEWLVSLCDDIPDG
ncbi:MAG: LysR family transcriptional regulator [Boseongicola sp.]|nr:LysR family transcriptional regulator [Boseongicola sp.]